MATAYPSTFPRPRMEGFASVVASGLVKTEDPSHQAQRRVFTSMPQRFSLTFVMTVRNWALWQNWAITNGYRWFQIDLPTLYAGQVGADLSTVTVRFTSDISVALVSQAVVQISVTAESAPNMYVNPVTYTPGLDMSNALNSQYAPLIFNGI